MLLSSHDLPEEDSKILSNTFHIINDLERIGDHAENILELSTEKISKHLKIGESAKNELIEMYNKTLEALDLALGAYKNKDADAALNIIEIEDAIDEHEKNLRENNMVRLNKKVCSANISTIFLDIISNLERIGDHATNIAQAVK